MNLSLQTQITILIVAILLVTVWRFKIFCNKYRNRLYLALGIVLILIWLGIAVRFLLPQLEKYEPKPIFIMPCSIKCIIPIEGCMAGDFDIWTVMHFFLFFILGLFLPCFYPDVILLSFGFEILEAFVGLPFRFILDPVINITGYFLGSLLNDQIWKNAKDPYECHCLECQKLISDSKKKCIASLNFLPE